MQAWIGLPEEDGGIPVIISGTSQHHHFIFIDTLGRKEPPVLSVDTPELQEKFQAQGIFQSIDVSIITNICIRAYTLLEQTSETWEVFKQLLPNPKKLPTLPALMDSTNVELSGLMNSQMGICIALPDVVLLEGLRGIQLVKKNQDSSNETNKNIDVLIEAVINTTANLALENMHREWWVLVMECMGHRLLLIVSVFGRSRRELL